MVVNQSILAYRIISCSGYSGALFVVQSCIGVKTDPCHKPRVCLATRAPRCETPVFSQRCTRTLLSHYPSSSPYLSRLAQHISGPGFFYLLCRQAVPVAIVVVGAVAPVRALQVTVVVVVVVGGGGGGPSPGPSGHRGRGRGRGQGGVPPINRTSVLKGKCSFYWSTGACNRGFDCTFKHEARPGVQASSSARQPTDFTPDFFSPQGLAINNGSIVDSQHNLCPSEVHNHLKPYLLEYFVFRNAIHVEGFSRIFASVNARNRAWVRNNTSMILIFLTVI